MLGLEFALFGLPFIDPSIEGAWLDIGAIPNDVVARIGLILSGFIWLIGVSVFSFAALIARTDLDQERQDNP